MVVETLKYSLLRTFEKPEERSLYCYVVSVFRVTAADEEKPTTDDVHILQVNKQGGNHEKYIPRWRGDHL